MTTRFRLIAPAFALFVGAMGAMPLAQADTAVSANNASPTNVATQRAPGPAANYDGFDRFRDAAGHPLPGWEYLFNSPG